MIGGRVGFCFCEEDGGVSWGFWGHRTTEGLRRCIQDLFSASTARRSMFII